MATSIRPDPAWSGHAFLAAGFRPFFLLAAIWAALGMALWILALHAALVLPTAFDPVSWHAHEMLFGYLVAVMAGFLLTALPSWTGTAPVAGRALLGLVTLWLLGRIAIAVSDHLSPLSVAAVDLSFLVVLGAVVLHRVVRGRNWRNLVVVGLLFIFVIGNAAFHEGAARGGHAASGIGLRIAAAAAVLLIGLIGGRIVPAFTRNWLAGRQRVDLPAAFGWMDSIAVSSSALALASWIAAPRWSGTGILLLAAGIAQVGRLARWRGTATRAEPLVWILHVGYAFIPAGMLALGAATLWPAALPGSAAVHLWMTGAVGVMTAAVMTRATLGHTGRPLAASAGTTTLYLLVLASVFTRFLASMQPGSATTLLTLSAALWCAGFGGFVALYGPMLVRARVTD